MLLVALRYNLEQTEVGRAIEIVKNYSHKLEADCHCVTVFCNVLFLDSISINRNQSTDVMKSC